MTSAAPRYARAVVDVVTAAHPYRDAIRGDLEEEFARRAAEAGPSPAQMWYAREALRTSAAILRRARITPAGALWIVAVVFAAYGCVLGADRVVALVIWSRHAELAPFPARVVTLASIILEGALAGYAVSRMARRPPFVGALAFLLLTLGVGAHYVGAAVPHELWLRAAKVAALFVAAAIGALRGGLATRPS